VFPSLRATKGSAAIQSLFLDCFVSPQDSGLPRNDEEKLRGFVPSWRILLSFSPSPRPSPTRGEGKDGKPLPQGERGCFRHCERPKGARQSSLCFWIASSAHKIPGFLAMTKKSFVSSRLRGEFFFLFPPHPAPLPQGEREKMESLSRKGRGGVSVIASDQRERGNPVFVSGLLRQPTRFRVSSQ
jgi:hypothetical protein